MIGDQCHLLRGLNAQAGLDSRARSRQKIRWERYRKQCLGLGGCGKICQIAVNLTEISLEFTVNHSKIQSQCHFHGSLIQSKQYLVDPVLYQASPCKISFTQSLLNTNPFWSRHASRSPFAFLASLCKHPLRRGADRYASAPQGSNYDEA